ICMARPQRSKVVISTFFSVFLLAALTQLVICRYYRRTTAQNELKEWAQHIASELKFSTGRWNLTRYRQADFNAGDHYYVLDQNGTIIDMEGFVPGLDLRLAQPVPDVGLQTIKVSETGESWRLFVRLLEG